jgi:hypothetical protein
MGQTAEEERRPSRERGGGFRLRGEENDHSFCALQSGFAGTMISFSSWKGWDLHTFGALFCICRGVVLEMVLTESKCTVPESKDQ